MLCHKFLILKTFWHILGDLGQTYNSFSTLKHYMQSGGQTVLFLGDLSYADRYEYDNIGIRWDSWGRFIERSAAYQPWIWSAGNHEIEFMPNIVSKGFNSAFSVLLFDHSSYHVVQSCSNAYMSLRISSRIVK